MKKKGPAEGAVEGPPLTKAKQMISPPSMTEIRAPMLPTMKKQSRKEIELDTYANPFKNKLIEEVEEAKELPFDHEPYFN